MCHLHSRSPCRRITVPSSWVTNFRRFAAEARQPQQSRADLVYLVDSSYTDMINCITNKVLYDRVSLADIQTDIQLLDLRRKQSCASLS